MNRTFILSALPFIGAAALSLGSVACSSSDSKGGDNNGGSGGDTSGSTGGSSSKAGATGTGGSTSSSSGGSTSSAGGSSAKGGASGSAGAGGDPYTCAKRMPPDPGGTGKAGDTCCKTSQGFSAGTCVKTSTISDPLRKAAYGHDSCAASTDAAADLKCSPTDAALADAGSLRVYDDCKATFGGSLSLEGRCLPKCFVAGMPAAANLAQETCSTKDFVCAPCYSPIDGSDTGACSQKPGDKPVEPKPAAFKKCGALKAGDPDLGICVPQALVTDQVQQMALKAAFEGDAGVVDMCPSGQVCAPSVKAMDINACFKHCTSIAGPGACVPTYLVPASQRSTLASTPDVCDKATEMCAPCTNPLMNNATTGACD